MLKLSLAPLQSRMATILYFHHRLMASVIFIIGGCVALSVVYLFLFTTAPLEPVQTPTDDTKISKEALARVILWNKKKQEAGSISIFVPSSVFATPPVTP